MAARRAVSVSMPSRKPEWMMAPGPVYDSAPTVNDAASSPGGSTTAGVARPYLRAKSRSRWSPAGQPKMAPVPYSMSTKLAIHTGNVTPGRKGWVTRRPVS